MTRDEILKASPDELRVMVAEALGWRIEARGEHFCLVGPTGRDEGWSLRKAGSEFSFYGDLFPDWPRDVAAAWELVGEMNRNWLLTFHIEHTGPEGQERNQLRAEGNHWDMTVRIDVIEPFEVAVCRLWLLVKEAERGS